MSALKKEEGSSHTPVSWLLHGAGGARRMVRGLWWLGGRLVPRCVPAAPHPSGVEGGRTCVDVWDVKVCVDCGSVHLYTHC